MNNKSGKPFLIIILAVALLAALSMVPWHDLTGGRIKDFNLIGDVLRNKPQAAAAGTEQVDPELAAALQEIAQEPHATNKPADADEHSKYGSDSDTSANSTAKDPSEMKDVQPSRVGETVVIEDYTAGGSGLSHLRSALARGNARVAVIGDSYIEGDIFTMNLREALQDKYGGSGVGYMPLQSALTGFRTSVAQTCKGWTVKDIRKSGGEKYPWLAGEYFTAGQGAQASYRGKSRPRHLDRWGKTQFVFIAPKAGNITLTTDAGTRTYPVEASEAVQAISVQGSTTNASVSTDIAGLQALGMFLDGDRGISVDNMSLRGNSGITHRKLSAQLASDMRRYVDYDLIVVEYGINALTSTQKNYDQYGRIMQQTVRKLRECYPNADIVMMAIGDRGQKIDGAVASLPTSGAMVDAQRDAARKTGILFWDTREAMGGENAVVDWRNRGLINADYIHLNAKGGAELAGLFVKALNQSLK